MHKKTNSSPVFFLLTAHSYMEHSSLPFLDTPPFFSGHNLRERPPPLALPPSASLAQLVRQLSTPSPCHQINPPRTFFFQSKICFFHQLSLPFARQPSFAFNSVAHASSSRPPFFSSHARSSDSCRCSCYGSSSQVHFSARISLSIL